MISFVKYFLNRLWSSWMELGLLDDGDFELLEDFFEENVVGIEKFQWPLLEFLSIFIIGIPLLICSYQVFIFVALLCVLIFASTPILFTKHWRIFDEKFNLYLSNLREKEICLFSLQPSGRRYSSSQTLCLLPFRQSRKNYLKCLRNFTKTFHLASQSLCSSKEDVDKLFINFIGPEMHSLLFGNYDDNEQDFLSIKALKSLWQCMFLVRSEFLRLFLSITRKDIYLCRPFEFIKHFLILLKTFWQTFYYFDDLDLKNRKRQNLKIKEDSKFKNEKWKGLTNFAICRAQLENVLERFDNDSLNKNLINEQMDEEFVLNIIYQLELIINLLKDVRYSKEEEQNDKNLIKFDNKVDEALNEQETLILNCETKSEEDEDFQIFELDPNFTPSTSSTENKFEGEDLNNYNLSFNSSSNVAIKNELKNVLNERKEFCLKREIQALARLRGVLPQEIEREELDRNPFNFCKEEHKITDKMPTKINRGVFGSSIDKNCLNSILEKREAIFAQRCDELKIEEFGEENKEENY